MFIKFVMKNVCTKLKFPISREKLVTFQATKLLVYHIECIESVQVRNSDVRYRIFPILDTDADTQP